MQPFGEPVADDLHLVDVVLGEWRDEAAAEPVILRRGGQRPHAAGGPTESAVSEGAHHVRSFARAQSRPARANPLGDAAVFRTASPKHKAET